MGKSKKRKRSQAEGATQTDVGLGATLTHLRGPEPSPSVNGELAAHESDSGEWEVVNKKKKKKTNYPRLKHNELHRMQASVKLGDLQALLLYCLADGTSPQWISIQHHAMVQKAVVLFVPGLEKGMFNGSIPLDQTVKDLKDLSESNGISDPTVPGDPSTLEVINHVANNAQSNRLDSHLSTQSLDDFVPSKLALEVLPAPLKPLADIFPLMWPIKAPGDDRMSRVHSPLQAMLQSPITKTGREEQEDKQIKGPKPARESKSWENRRTKITNYIICNEDLVENDYVLHPACFPTSQERENALLCRTKDKQAADDGWVDSRIKKIEDGSVADTEIQQGSLTAGRKILAVDCEMCKVQGGDQALTRISMVGWDGEIVMDELIKPDKPIIDYLTPYSGMTAEKLAPVSTSLEDIQTRLLDLLTPHTILVGHSLNSDLDALQLTHPFIIDTALLYPHPRGPPLKSSLKWLAQKYLGREIQKGHGIDGHNSVEDALACLDLVKLKCEKGPAWGTYEATVESVFKRLNRAPKAGLANTADATGKTGAIIDHGAPEKNFGQMATYCIGCGDDAEIVAGVKRAVLGDPDGSYIPGIGVDFTWARLRELEISRGWRNDNATPPPPIPSPAALVEAVTRTVDHIKNIREFLPPCTLFIVYSGTGDPREMARLQEMQRTFKREFQTKKWDQLSVKWTDREEQALKQACRKAREGVGFATIT